ncbi:MAG: NAD+ kinase [Chloroflexi bacterium]|nr:NAD+ kinase [Chloroflexota bacterium]
MEFEKIVLVTRKTRLEGLIERFNTIGQAKFYLEHGGGDFGLYQREHDVYYAAVTTLRSKLQELVKLQEIERGLLPNFLFTEANIVVTIGIDGLVANTAKYLSGQPLIAVNPDPAHIDGILLPFDVQKAVAAAQRVLKNQMTTRKISMADVQLNDGQNLLAFNDFFVGVKSHISARYSVEINGQQERQSSSGIIVSTGVGSTGWLSSMFNMANGVLAGIRPAGDKIQITPPARFDWESEQLVFVVREPFISKTSSAKLVFGHITKGSPLVIHSEIPESGVIFSDGVESDFLAFNSGAIATISLADKKTNLVVG